MSYFFPVSFGLQKWEARKDERNGLCGIEHANTASEQGDGNVFRNYIYVGRNCTSRSTRYTTTLAADRSHSIVEDTVINKTQESWPGLDFIFFSLDDGFVLQQ